MCGIHGFNFKDEALLSAMIANAHHRGPDGNGSFFSEHLSLGHNLLYITERPEHSRQPWVLEDGRFVLSFNGEIYNYRELRKELQSTGEKFHTDCDTEVLAIGLRKYGKVFIENLDGMFAFAWYDSDKQSLLLARDPGGMKPLYYYNQNNRFVFSSELSSLLLHGMERKFDQQSLGIYMQLGYIPGPKTLIKNIFKLSPGEVIEVALANGEIKNRQMNCDRINKSKTDFDVAAYSKKFTQSIEHAMIGIRQFGLYLSGGLDSSAILHETCELGFKPITLSTRFETKNDKEFNEDAECAKKLSQHYGTKHIEVCITEKDFIDAIEPTYLALEEPRYNRNTPAYYLAAKAMADSGVTITLSGDGGDEMLTGYPHHSALVFLHNTDPSLWQDFKRFVKLNYTEATNNSDKTIERWCEAFRFPTVLPEMEKVHNLNEYMKTWLKLRSISNDIINNQLFLEQLGWLPEDALIRNDKLGMHFSMEARFPFLSRQFREYTMSIPHKQKLSANQSKLMARQALEGKLPGYILNKRKSGWTTPVRDWNKKGKFGERIKEIMSRDYYAPLYDMPDFAAIVANENLKTRYACLYLQVWAKQFKVTA